MRTLAITNHKGGSAKTTTAVNLAAAFGELGLRVLVMDLDPQGSASAWLGVPRDDRSASDALFGRAALHVLARPTTAPGVDLVPASPGLVAADRRQETEIALGIIRAVERTPPRWDLLIVDCPPSQGYLAIAPLAVCHEVLVPVESHVLALAGLSSVIATMERVSQRLNPQLTLSAILACRVNRTTHSREVVELLRRRHGHLVLTATVRENIRLAEAPSFQLPITRYAPGSTGAPDHRTVAAELLRDRTTRTAERERDSLGRLFDLARHGPGWLTSRRGRD